MGEGGSLGSMGPEPRVDLHRLLHELNDPCWRTRGRAARGLGASGDRRVAPALVRTLGDRSAAVRRAAALSLERLGPLADEALIDAYHQAGPVLRRSLIEVLADSSVGSRERSRPLVDLLIAALDDPDLAVRALALGALIRAGEPRAVDRLIDGLGRAEPSRWRELCAWGLGVLGAASAFEPLAALLARGDESAALQMASIKALRSIDNARAVDLIHRLLATLARPGRRHLSRTLAALDLLGAVGLLCRKVQQGHVDTSGLKRALEAVQAEAALARRKSRTDGPSPPQSPGDSAERIRRLETYLRTLAHSEQEYPHNH